ncbi:MAG: hypothetical protein FWH44_03805 [Methanomassiliicoccaceae archaeon]|nr:hypothetical protein [Methanomassiliicoccaceae archaeon]
MTSAAQYDPDTGTMFTVTVNAGSEEGGKFEYRLDGAKPYKLLTGPISAVYGSLVEIRAVVNDGYSFEWDDERATGNIIALTVTSDEDLTGKFSPPAGKVSNLIWTLMMPIYAFFLLLILQRNRRREA